LVAICGTPLLVGGDFVGVLFAAHRTRRPFARAEVALLGSLAALAAVSLVQSRRATATAATLVAAHQSIAQPGTRPCPARTRGAGSLGSGLGCDKSARSRTDQAGRFILGVATGPAAGAAGSPSLSVGARCHLQVTAPHLTRHITAVRGFGLWPRRKGFTGVTKGSDMFVAALENEGVERRFADFGLTFGNPDFVRYAEAYRRAGKADPGN
jgi:hypothetical protein